jgi:DNA-binding transcriptional regulator YhcF (GntR family)
MNRKQNLTDQLRERIVSAIHTGHLRAGDRLPSIRQLAAETDEDARAVARAYRALEGEGLVDVRERSGIYVAPQSQVGGLLLEETAQWAARVLVDAWNRGIPTDGVLDFFRRCTAIRKVRCAFVETSEDVITAFTHDLRERLGLETQPVWLESLPPARPKSERKNDSVPPALRSADLVVTTAFHAREVGPLADSLAAPMIAATVNPNLVAAVERQLRSGALTVVCVDPRFGDRVRVQYQQLVTAENQIRVITVDDARSIAALDRTEPVLLTRAARERLGKVHFPSVFPHSPTISSSSALEIAEFLIRFNLEAEAVQQQRSRRNPPEHRRTS